MKTSIKLLILAMLLAACSPKISSHIEQKRPVLTIEDKVAFLDLYNKVPEGSEKLGSAKFGDSGFSTDCGFDENPIVQYDKPKRQSNLLEQNRTSKETVITA